VAGGALNSWAAAAYNRLALHVAIHCIDITGLAWTEIDYPSDLLTARERVLPNLRLA
jgi:choline kinase